MMSRIGGILAVSFFLWGCDQVKQEPEQDLAKIQSINSSFETGDYEAARNEVESYTEKYPECHQGWRLYGWSHAKLNELEEAAVGFNKAIELNPQADNAYVGLGVVKRKKGDLSGAREAYAEAIKIAPKNAEAFSSLLVIEIIDKDYRKAVEYGERSWALRKDLASIPANLAVAYHFLGNDEKKFYFYNEAKKLRYHLIENIDEIFEGTRVIDSGT